MWTKNWRTIAYLGVCLLASGCGGDPSEKFIAQLRDLDPAVRRTAARALDENPTADDRVLAALATCAADSDVEVRYFAISALGKCGPVASSTLPAIKSALQDGEKRVRLRAAFAVHAIDPQDRSFEPVLTSAMREGDGKTLLEIGAMGPDAAWAVPTLVGLLSHPSPQIRVLAANNLGHIGPAAASAAAALAAAAGDSNAAVKHAAQNALERLGTKSAGVGN